MRMEGTDERIFLSDVLVFGGCGVGFCLAFFGLFSPQIVIVELNYFFFVHQIIVLVKLYDTISRLFI